MTTTHQRTSNSEQYGQRSNVPRPRDRRVPPDESPFVYLERLLARPNKDANAEVAVAAASLLRKRREFGLESVSPVLFKACIRLFEQGNSTESIEITRLLGDAAVEESNLPLQRKAFSFLGGQLVDVADFSAAMQWLQRALAIARSIKDVEGEAACLSNVVALLQEMGHYRQAISLARTVLASKTDTPAVRGLRIQCASNGLFSAHRIGDRAAATEFLALGEENLPYAILSIGRAFFEKNRALYLIDNSRAAEARRFIDAALIEPANQENERARVLLGISHGLCEWAVGDKRAAFEELFTLYERSKVSRLYHHFVLQGLIKAHSDAATSAAADVGLRFARELVEYTTSVKKAKFYRQLATNRRLHEGREQAQLSITQVDPFFAVNDWLIASDVCPVDADSGEKRVLTKHEELNAIHDDMANLRAAALRRDIRTDAVDTAENWAIAAEFFDDETGQHCYRVGHLASMLAREIGMDETFCVQIEHAARLHDIGKIAVNELILLKPGPLDAAEMAAMRLHTEVGAQILSGSDDPTLMMAVEVARHHHEWWNGCGYPKKLIGRNTPISARISAYADVYDALTHARAYKTAWTHERSLEEIIRLGGTQFDPDLLAPFCKVLERYRADLDAKAIPGFADMDTNALISSRRKLMETIAASS